MENRNKFLFDYSQSDKVDEKLVEIVINKEWEKLRDFIKVNKITWINLENEEIFYFIREFTKNDKDDTAKKEMMKSLEANGLVDRVIIEESKKNILKAIIETDNKTIDVRQLSSVVPQVLEIYPFIETDQRYRKCFEMAFDFAAKLDFINSDADVVTGYVYGNNSAAKYIHSWLELRNNVKDKEPLVIDGTSNIIMNKDGYYHLRNAEPITRISCEQIRTDAQKYLFNLERFSPTDYFLFRDEMIKDFENNDFLFNESLRKK